MLLLWFSSSDMLEFMTDGLKWRKFPRNSQLIQQIQVNTFQIIKYETRYGIADFYWRDLIKYNELRDLPQTHLRVTPNKVPMGNVATNL